MKVKIVAFFGLLVAGIGVSVLIGSSPVYAAGEQYKWLNPDTIEGNGGLFREPTQFKKSASNTYQTTIRLDLCVLDLKLQVGADFITAGFSGAPNTSVPTNPGCTDIPGKFDQKTKIADPNKGPPLAGQDQEASKPNINCDQAYAGDENIDRCKAVKACPANKTDCLRAWYTCLINANSDNKVEPAERQRCAQLVTEGKLADATNPNATDDKNKTTCVIDGIGWIVCPVFNFLSKVTDQAYTVVDGFLVINPLGTTNDSGIFNAWAIMRNFANVAFVIFFLVIIFSQLTSIGISNYGIKKLLPKLIVVAILVNISYWICAVAVDLSNILGGSLKALLDGVKETASVKPVPPDFWSSNGSALLAGALAGAAIATTALFFASLSVFLPLLVVVLATIVSVFLVLVLRQVFVIILIVISPIALVAYLLPNTESFTRKWRTAFQFMLLVYPIIAFVFGASGLAAAIIMASSDKPYVQFAGAAAAIIPLVAAPALVSNINKVTGQWGMMGVGVKLGGLKQKAEGYRDYRKDITRKRRFDRSFAMNDKTGRILGEKGTKRRRLAAWVAGGGVTTGRNIERRREEAKKSLAKTEQRYEAGRTGITKDSTEAEKSAAAAYAKVLAGPTGNATKIMADAQLALEKAFLEDIEPFKAVHSSTKIGNLDTSGNEIRVGGVDPQGNKITKDNISKVTVAVPGLKSIMKDRDRKPEERAAAAAIIAERGADKDIHEALDYLGTNVNDELGNIKSDATKDEIEATSDLQKIFSRSLGKRKPISLGGSDGSALTEGSYMGSFKSKQIKSLTKGKRGGDQFVTAPKDELDAYGDLLEEEGDKMMQNAETANTLSALHGSIIERLNNKNLPAPSKEVKDKLVRVMKNLPPPPPPKPAESQGSQQQSQNQASRQPKPVTPPQQPPQQEDQ